MVVKKFILNDKEVNQIYASLSFYAYELSKLGISLEEKPELESVLKLFAPCVSKSVIL